MMKKDNLLAAWSPRYSGAFINSDMFIETLYNSLTDREHAPHMRHN